MLSFSTSPLFLVFILLSTLLLGGVGFPLHDPAAVGHLQSRDDGEPNIILNIILKYRKPLRNGRESSQYLPGCDWTLTFTPRHSLVIEPQEITGKFVLKVIEFDKGKYYPQGTALATVAHRSSFPTLMEDFRKIEAQNWPADCFNLVFEQLKTKKILDEIPILWTSLYNEMLETGAIQLRRQLVNETNGSSETISLYKSHVDPREKWTLYIGTKHGFTAVPSPTHSDPSRLIASKVTAEFKGEALVDTVFGSTVQFDAVLKEVLRVPVEHYNMDWIDTVLEKLEELRAIEDMPKWYTKLYSQMIDTNGDAAGNTVDYSEQYTKYLHSSKVIQ
ncbi:hypothetical protein EV368DRAFT_65859 [Lentinula lateritia]|nr:hypothetical protein EV368DRAFT_65859 [Lentinula lateritia]